MWSFIYRVYKGIHRRLNALKFRGASPHKVAELMRPHFYYLGKNVMLYTTNFGTEPYLISIDDNVSVAAGVCFINHDISCFHMADYLGIDRSKVDKVGSIILHKNCYVGAYSILMPNCSVGENSIVAAGSIVTKHIPDGEVWGGIPAKFIMKVEDYARKVEEKSKEYPWLENKETMSQQQLIRERQKYFFESD